MPSRTLVGLILAAGKGTRMKSDLPKCLHKVCGVPMVKLVADAMIAAGVQDVVIVVGHGGERLISELGSRYRFAWQHEQLGTGHAVQCAMNEIGEVDGDVLIACGDTPLVSIDYFKGFVESHQQSGEVCSLSVAKLVNAHGYGRVVIHEGKATQIIEDKDANDLQKQITFANAGMYCVDGKSLTAALSGLKTNNAQGEYYLTDIIATFDKQGKPAAAYISNDPAIMMGVNDRKQLAEANCILRKQIAERHMLNGVTLVDPNNTYISPAVTIGQDTVIEPGSHLIGNTTIGTGCTIGPNTKLTDAKVGDNTMIFMSHADSAVIGSKVKIGPFANIRPKSVLKDGVRIGNFVEVNRSTLENGVKANHLTYIGDSEVGEETNVGAGTITCNYDGFAKHKTVIGKNVFVGSNSTLVAPVQIEDDTMIAAGSVITDDVPKDAFAFGRARQVTKPGRAKEWKEAKKSDS